MTKQSFLDQTVMALAANARVLTTDAVTKGDCENLWEIAECLWQSRPATVKTESKGRFVKPSIIEVQAYITEKKYKNVDAATWINHYESKGWVIGKNKMKDWKAAVRTWGAKESGSGPAPKNKGFV